MEPSTESPSRSTESPSESTTPQPSTETPSQSTTPHITTPSPTTTMGSLLPPNPTQAEIRRLLPSAPVAPTQLLPRPFKVYLAGPDVFVREPRVRGQELKNICTRHNLIGLFPLDNALGPDPETGKEYLSSTHAMAVAIRSSNMALIHECDGVLANMTPFRGPSMDVGTAYEIGVAAGLGKPVVGYTLDRGLSYVEKVQQWARENRTELLRTPVPTLDLRDASGMHVEEFMLPARGVGLPDNLMITAGGLEGYFLSEDDGARALARVLGERVERVERERYQRERIERERGERGVETREDGN